jgi:hypothetical protein
MLETELSKYGLTEMFVGLVSLVSTIVKVVFSILLVVCWLKFVGCLKQGEEGFYTLLYVSDYILE